MKNILIIAAIAFLGFIGNDAQAQDNTRDQYEIYVDGLGCPFCAYGLEKRFKKFKGIKKIRIDMETGQFTFEYPQEDALSLERVEKQVESAGYTAVKTKITRVDGTVEENDNTIREKNLAKENLIEEEFYVFGNCDMCRARIEKVTNRMDAVNNAKWDEDTQMLKISYDKTKLSRQDIETRLAQAGHDTKNAKSTEANYNSLPKCCRYKRELN